MISQSASLPSAPGAQQDGELADKAVQARQAHRRQADDQGQHGVHRHHFPQPAEFIKVARVAAFVDHADDQKQSACAQAVVDHLQDAALDALGIEGEQAEHHEPEVADGRIRHQLLDVFLPVRHRGTV